MSGYLVRLVMFSRDAAGWQVWMVLIALLIAAASGCAPATDRPSVLLITLDTTRADRLGCYGYADAETPTLDRLADEGTLFERAVSPVPTTRYLLRGQRIFLTRSPP